MIQFIEQEFSYRNLFDVGATRFLEPHRTYIIPMGMFKIA